MEMEIEYKLRQEKNVLISNLSDDEKTIKSYYIDDFDKKRFYSSHSAPSPNQL